MRTKKMRTKKMRTKLMALIAALGIAGTSIMAMAAPVSAQSVQGPLYNHHYQSNGTGTIPDGNRDPHNNR